MTDPRYNIPASAPIFTLIGPPCLICGADGGDVGYWIEPDAHEDTCPFYGVKGADARAGVLARVLRELRGVRA